MSLGRRQLHDPRNRDFTYLRARGICRSVHHILNAPHVDQFYLNACVGFSGTNFLNCADAVFSRKAWNEKIRAHKAISWLTNDDGIRNYSESTKRDPFPGQYPPDDVGSSALGLMKWWMKLGIIKQYHWTFTFASFLDALGDQPVLVGTNWYEDMMTTQPDGVVRSEAQGFPVGGHEYLATEIRWHDKLIGFEQSWGDNPVNFGRHGRFWMPFELAEELIIRQGGDVVVPIML